MKKLILAASLAMLLMPTISFARDSDDRPDRSGRFEQREFRQRDFDRDRNRFSRDWDDRGERYEHEWYEHRPNRWFEHEWYEHHPDDGWFWRW